MSGPALPSAADTGPTDQPEGLALPEQPQPEQAEPEVPESEQPQSAFPEPARRRPRLLGFALVAPALVALILSYLVPTVSTVVSSFQQVNLFGPSEWVGLDNYRAVVEDGVLAQFAFALLLGVPPLVFALLVAPLLAVLADRAGRAARLVTRGALVLPVAGYAPVAVFLAWGIDRMELSTLDGARTDLVWMLSATSFGLVVAVAATAYLGVLRQATPARHLGPAMLVVSGLLTLGVLAMALQIVTGPRLITGGEPGGTTRTPLLGAMTNFSIDSLGISAATSALLLAVLGLLGLGAAGLLVATQARIEFDGWRDARPGSTGSPPAVAGWRRYARLGVLVVALAAFLGIVGWAFAPWLSRVFPGDGVPRDLDIAVLFADTWLKPLTGALVSVGLAAVAGFGIGALRPLGRWSELLLLPFAPWLFVGLGPVVLDRGPRLLLLLGFERGLLGLVPLTALSVPALFAFTLLFRAQQSRWRGDDGLGRALLLPAMPMLILAVLLTTIFNAQQSNWGMLTGGRPTDTAPGLAEQTTLETGELDSGLLGLVLPFPIFLVLLVAFVGIQLGYLDRLAVRVGQASSTG